MDGRVCVCNDLTKKFERIYRGTVDEVFGEIENNEKSELGEYAIVFEKAEIETTKQESTHEVSVEARIFDCVLKGMSIKEAVGKVSDEGVSRNEAYTAGLNVKKYL